MIERDQEYREKAAALRRLLEKYSIPLEAWGKGSAKTIDHLLGELAVSESTLTEEKGELIRKTRQVFVEIYFKRSDEVKYHLFEEKQVFDEGSDHERVRIRKNLPASLGGKVSPNEDPQIGADRETREELGIVGELDLVYLFSTQGERMTDSYPGLHTKFEAFHFETYLRDDQFNPNGYIEKQDDKTTYFSWELVS